jgi:hypothetical protein
MHESSNPSIFYDFHRRNSMLRKPAFPIVLTVLVLLAGASAAQAFGNDRPAAAPLAAPFGYAFTYQGFLQDAGSPADGVYDLQFRLFDDPGTDTQVGTTVTKNDVDVAEGYFTAELDFGSVFDGTALWLEIWVRPGASSGGYTQLLPRQPLNPAPYAIYASHIPLAGSGSAQTAARSDHTHSEYLTEEVDPYIGDTSEAGKLCQSNGVVINCDVSGVHTVTKYVQMGPPDVFIAAKAHGLPIITHGVSNVQFDPSFSGTFYVPSNVPTGTTITGASCYISDTVGGTVSLSLYVDTIQCGSTATSSAAGLQYITVTGCSLNVMSSSRGTPLYLNITTSSASRYLYACSVSYTYTGIE